MPSQPSSLTLTALLLCVLLSPLSAAQQPASQASNTGSTKDKSSAKPPNPEEELQRALSDAGSDRASLVRNLESFLTKYPNYPNRTSIYRAVVEASLQLKDNVRAADYSERMVSLNPNDISILLLAIELLERQDDQAGFRRAVSYSTRILDLVAGASPAERSARVSLEQWEQQKKSDLANTHFMRGDLYFKLRDYDAAREDLE